MTYSLEPGRTKDIGFKVINFVRMWVQHIHYLCCRIQKNGKIKPPRFTQRYYLQRYSYFLVGLYYGAYNEEAFKF